MSESSVNNSTSVNIRKVEEDSKQISDSNNKNEMNYLNQPDAEDVPEKPIPSPTFPTDGHQIDPECEKLLRATKVQVKRLMEEAVTRKMIHADSGCLISLCVAIDACLTHGLKRRVLGLFKTSSSMALVHKIAKICSAAQEILDSLDKYKQSLSASAKTEQRDKNNKNIVENKAAIAKAPQAPIRRYQWIKFALIEKKLFSIVEYLVDNASKYYDPEALVSDHSCAQILLSLLAGPVALDFSHNKISDLQFQEDPTAFDLIKRHKLANPIVCLCKQEDERSSSAFNNHSELNRDCDTDNIDNMVNVSATGLENRSSLGKQPEIGANESKHRSESIGASPFGKNRVRSSSLNRRRPLSIKTNAKRPTLITECRHYSCQEITEHRQSRGYSLLCTSLHGPLSAPTTTFGPSTFSNTQQQHSSARSPKQQNNNKKSPLANNQLAKQPINNTYDNKRQSISSSQASEQQAADRSWSLWSPRMLHEIMHQNAKFKLLYGKNNVLLENEKHNFTAGYLSLHETDQDVILKWIPNQMINGSQHQQNHQQQANDCGKNLQNDHYDPNQLGLNNPNKWGQIGDEPTPIESSFLELVVSIPMSTIVLLHCHFRSSSIEILDDENCPSVSKQETSDRVADHYSPEVSKNDDANDRGDDDDVISNEETLILFEADGVQRAPFKFPKGGLRLFLSCLEASLAPDRYLEPAISLDPISQWPQHPFAREARNGANNAASSGRTTPLGHSSSLGDKPAGPSMSDNNVDRQENESNLSRLDSFLRRLPSLKRKINKPQSASSLGNSDQEAKTNDASNQSPIGRENLASTNNYVYRIVHVQQPSADSSVLTASTDGSIASSPGCIGNGGGGCSNQFRNKDQSLRNKETAGFRWTLRRWANFSRPSNGLANQSSSSTLSSSFGPQNGLPGNELGSPSTASSATKTSNNQTPDQTTTITSELHDVEDPLRSTIDRRETLSSAGEEEDEQEVEQNLRNFRNHSLNDNSIKLARVEAKLNDLKKSTSEEVLESFRTASIQTLCESMRKQIVARAFYGWLVHCRRAKMIHKHLSHLLHPIDGGKWLLHRADELNGKDMNDNQETAIGLTKNKWDNLMTTTKSMTSCSEDMNELISNKVSLSVYLGGIEDNELRKLVWPHLLKQYDYSDDFEERNRKDLKARQAYESCVSEWILIEQEVKQRDNEILEANIARAKQDSSATHKTHRQLEGESEVDPNLLKSPEGGDKLETQSNTLTETSNGVDGENKVVEPEVSKQTTPRSLSTNKTTFTDELTEDKPEVELGEACNQSSTTIKDGCVSASAALQCNNIDSNNNNNSSKRRWRLESTGSVGSDEPIIYQFGNNIHRIDKDVQRCDRNFWYFKDKQNLDKLRNIMCTYVWQNLKVGYVQGMCDLAAPFLVIFDDEVNAFQCFNQLMSRMVENFPLGAAMDQHFEALKYLIQVMDPKLFQVLQCNNDDNSCFYFCYRWLLLDFKRELSYADVFLVWETIWAARDVATDQFVVFLALAMVRYYRDIIIENDMDYTDTLKFFNEMAERHDVKRILELARESVNELYNMISD